MMLGVPDPSREACFHERRVDVLRETGLEVDDVGDRMKTWPIHGLASAQALVDDAGHDLDERAPQASPAGGAKRER